MKNTTRSRGLTIIEVIIAMMVLAIAMLALMSAVLASGNLRESTREQAIGYNAARKMIEQMRSEPFASIYAKYSPGGAAGDTFTVDGLNPQAGLPVGEIAFPTSGSPPELREDVDDPLLGMPRDMNGDATVDALAHDTDYQILPVRITVRWQSVHGQAQIVIHTQIAEK